MQDVVDEEETSKTESERGMSPTMSLVIGIIIGSFTAMFLIVIIVLKVKTGVDISEDDRVVFLSNGNEDDVVIDLVTAERSENICHYLLRNVADFNM